MSRSILYIAKLDEVLKQIREAFQVETVTAQLIGEKLIIWIKIKLTNDLEHLSKVRKKVEEFFGIDPSKFKAKVEGSGNHPRLVLVNDEENLSIEVGEYFV